MWKVEDAKIDEWVERMADRIRNLLRHCQQARCKMKPPSWVAALGLPPWERKGNRAARTASSDEEDAEEKAPTHEAARTASSQRAEPLVEFDVATGTVTLRKGHNKFESNSIL